VLIKQWDPKKAPLSPFATIILAAGDIALEYVTANPNVMGASGNGEKLLGAFAVNLSDVLPDDGNFGTGYQFGERLLGAFLRAGLATISDNPEWIVSEKHVQELMSASVKPVIKSLPEDITEQFKYRMVTEALIGPAASTAMQTLAKHPDVFLGGSFKPEKAIGALTQALFKQAAQTGLRDQFTKEGLINLYQSALEVAVQHPQLFLGDDEQPKDQLVRDLFMNFTTLLKDSPPPFDGSVGSRLAAAALETISSNAHRFAHAGEAWDKTAADLVAVLTEQLGKAFLQKSDLERIFSKDQLVELGRVFLTQVAATPEMITGHREALSQMVGAITQAMVNDQNLLLNGKDWIEIAKVAAEEAAANPHRLFKLDMDDPTEALAARVIGVMLQSAEDIVNQPDSRSKTVLFGKTLREAIIIGLRATAGKPAAVAQRLQEIEVLVRTLSEFVAGNAGNFGNKEWLNLFQMLLARVLLDQELPQLTVDSVNDLLAGG
jgi:hypothetical protein